MKLSEFKKQLENAEKLEFMLSNGKKIPSHFHITEIGLTTKQFTDCGNTFRTSKTAAFQLWNSVDLYHRLEPKKMIRIIDSTAHLFNGEDLEIEIEYQLETVSKFGLDYIDGKFILTNTKTDCLAKSNCGIQTEKIKQNLEELASCCNTNSSCC